MRKVPLLIYAVMLLANDAYAVGPAQQPSGSAPDAVKNDWKNYLVDTAPTSTSAAGMLGIGGDEITTVGNVRDLSIALKPLTTGGAKSTIAFSITPARTSIVPMDQSDYVNNGAMRVLGSITLGYAQGDATVSNVLYSQQAVSVETSGFFDKEQDPVVALYHSVSEGKLGCGAADIIGTPQTPPQPQADETNHVAPRASPEVSVARQKAWQTCIGNVKKEIPWNRSAWSFGYASGWIQPTSDVSNQVSLGQTGFVGAQWGFGNKTNKDGSLDKTSTSGWLLAVAFRRTFNEPVLDTLANPQVSTKDSNLCYVKLSGGNNDIRGLLQYSNTNNNIMTSSQQAFKLAVGVDAKLLKNGWLSFRFGKLRAIDGTKDDWGSLMSLSYSPESLL